MRVFPTCKFAFDGRDVDIERRTISGGVALSSDEDTIQVDGGGRVYAQFTDAYLDEDEYALAWRAISARYGEGDPIIVPLGVYETQMMGAPSIPPGGLPWWEETDFASADAANVTLGADAALRATQLTLTIEFLSDPVRGGQWLSIDHTTWRHRAYRIAEVISDDGATVVVSVRPPLREAVTTGTVVELVDPKCVMKIDGAMGSPEMGGFPEGSVRFVEDFTGDYS
jgi:hypothetical protein